MEFNNIKELLIGIREMFREFFNKDTNKKQRANMWTFSRLVMAFIIPVLAVVGKIAMTPFGYILASLVTCCGAFTDFMDGRSARKYNSVSKFGKKLDIVTDKVFSLMVGISLSILNPLFLINLFGEIMISSVNVFYKSRYIFLDTGSSFIGKVKQWPLSISFILGFLSLFLPQLTSITYIFIFMSLILQLEVVREYININEQQIKKIESNTIDLVGEVENDVKEDLEKVNSISSSLKNEYINLRNVLNKIIISKNTQEESYIKIKKRK